MMATSQNIKEYEKGTKKTFASPTQKSHHVKPQADSWKEDPQGTSSLEAEAKPRRPRASPKKEQKTATEHGPNGGQEKKRKAQDKPAKKKGKEKQTLTNAEFEEIFQIVLRKSLQEYLGLGSGLNFAETSCVQPIIPTKSDKEPGIASPATDNENADGINSREEVIVPDTREIASSLEEEVDSEIRTSKPGQLAAEPSKKKSNRLSLSKRRKKSDEKMEEIQDGYECILKDKQKTTIQDPSQIRGQQKEEEGGFGQCLIWVQCSSSKCEKWRQLRGDIDPSVLPDNWSCDQNPDLNYNRCDIPEETWTGCESDVAYASYVPGSIVWAKQYGYPWWPGMIETDPDLGEYFLFSSHLDSLPSKYHVTYFGERVSRAWIPVSMLKNFQELSLELVRGKTCRNKDYNQKLEAAIAMAHKAEQINIQERVNLFGFRSRYSGSDSSGEGKDLMLRESSSPESCLQKEKDSGEEEKEEKEDPTLPKPKPAKIQTKKIKSRGPAGGQGGRPKEKTVKKSLSSESTIPLAPVLGGKEEQGNSELGHPGPKKKFKAPESKASATTLPEKQEIKIVSKCPTPPAGHGVCRLGKEGPGPQEPLTQEAAIFPLEDDGSSDLDLEQLMEDIGETEERGESQQRDGSEGFLAALFEE
ncbi:zinc finger CW-type PWWP domain protein 1 isoform X2 [Cricetulus griseus]|uniref:Zinc finger CW-type PWWP domain protein 1 isoform X2 n=1 Tax=Cricetulus griseus TaxID=10029 RepID=A0A9J7G1E6_CRIGR|nr:zinc finger CW-type PWWP domain protein 1 isoform X2 [Cricetulus griseus]XP_027272060.1 zinc finger CW-type PWWP domain protein 1 isoform X2 [Cricetulus griseus]